MDCGFRLPTTSGYCVQWHTGNVKYLKIGKTRAIRGFIETTSKETAEAKYKSLIEAGYKNVELHECIF